MFKLIGTFILSFLLFIYIYRGTVKDYITIIFLKDSIDVLQHVILKLSSGMTYPQIFKNYKSIFYRDFKFSDKERFFSEIINFRLIDKKTAEEVNNVFMQLGTHLLAEERTFIEYGLQNISLIYNDLLLRYKQNNRSNLIAGISAGIILFIVMI